jgi:preprotein translocase subunit SecA
MKSRKDVEESYKHIYEVLEYDDVMNQQREVIYGQRRKILLHDDLKENIFMMVDKITNHGMDVHANEKIYPEDWDYPALIEYLEGFFAPTGKLSSDFLEKLSREELKEAIIKTAQEAYENREKLFGESNMRELEKVIMLKVVDTKWEEHLDAMEMLRQGVGLRAYGQKDPLIEYKFEAFEMFQQMLENIQEDIVRYMFRINILTDDAPSGNKPLAVVTGGKDEQPRERRAPSKIAAKRNAPCPCGSGKKYKHCCGRVNG